MKLYQYLRNDSIKGFIFKIFLGISSLIIFAKLLLFHYKIIVNVFPNEYREGAILLVTDLMTKGGNPYDLANQPEYTNVYGILYHLVVLPFAHWFGVTLPVHRVITAVFIWASCAVFYVALRWQKVSFFFSFSSTLILYSHLLYYTTPLARPDSLGFFLFLSSLVIPWRFNYSSLSILSSITLAILGFLAKPYFILSILYLNLFLFLFVSKKKWFQHTSLTSVALTLTVLGVDRYYETYWNNTFWVNVNVADDRIDYAIRQLVAYGQINFGLIVIFALIILLSFNKANLNLEKINFWDLNKPLIQARINLIPFSLVVSMVLFVTKFGQHSGAWLTYLHHLITPFLILSVFDLLRNLEKVYKNKVFKGIVIGMIFINLICVSSSQVLPLPSYRIEEWDNIEALLLPYKSVFNSPAIASILVQQGKKIYDSGQSEYFNKSIPSQPFWNIFIPHKKREIEERYQQFIQAVTESVKAKKYDLIVITKKHSPFISQTLIGKYYEYKDSAIAPMSATLKRNWILEIWKPKQSQ